MELMFNLQEVLTVFMVLFAVIDITGAIPIIISLNSTGKKVQALTTSGISLIILIVFLFAGEALLRLFNTDIASFAVAGALVLFALAFEMIFSVEIFKSESNAGTNSTIVPMVFPLIAGPGTLTTALSMRAEYNTLNIILAIIINMIIVYIVIRKVNIVERIIGKNGIYIAKKLFGVILLAMSVKLFISNLKILLG